MPEEHKQQLQGTNAVTVENHICQEIERFGAPKTTYRKLMIAFRDVAEDESNNMKQEAVATPKAGEDLSVGYLAYIRSAEKIASQYLAFMNRYGLPRNFLSIVLTESLVRGSVKIPGYCYGQILHVLQIPYDVDASRALDLCVRILDVAITSFDRICQEK